MDLCKDPQDKGRRMNVIENQRNKMDWNYLLKHCKELSDFLNNSEIETFEKW